MILINPPKRIQVRIAGGAENLDQADGSRGIRKEKKSKLNYLGILLPMKFGDLPAAFLLEIFKYIF